MIRARGPALIQAAIEQSGSAALVDGFDAASWLADKRNIALSSGPNVGLFEHREGGTCEAHWLFAARGRSALRMARDMLAAMFDLYGKRAVSGQTPVQCRAARIFNRWLGGRSLGIIETPRGPVEIFFMSRDMFRAT